VGALVIAVGETYDVILTANFVGSSTRLPIVISTLNGHVSKAACIKYIKPCESGCAPAAAPSKEVLDLAKNMGGLVASPRQQLHHPFLEATDTAVIELSGNMKTYRWFINSIIFEPPPLPFTYTRQVPHNAHVWSPSQGKRADGMSGLSSPEDTGAEADNTSGMGSMPGLSGTDNGRTKKRTNVMQVALDSVVTVVFNNPSMMAHPMHLHGHNFWVLGTGGWNSGNFDSQEDRSLLNLVNPPSKNTINVPGGGWTVIRFLANNPGSWFFHCHIEYHMARGMEMTILVGEPSSWPWTLPDGMPLCANSATSENSCDVSGVGSYKTVDSFFTLGTVLVLIAAVIVGAAGGGILSRRCFEGAHHPRAIEMAPAASLEYGTYQPVQGAA